MKEVVENGRVCEYSSEEEMSVLPPHTKVVVTGNNRTKSVLVGLHGVVKKAVGLGGWHWLVLTNGIDVKLQRNALSVVEPPTGNEEDDDLEFENVQWNGSDLASEETQKSHRSIHRIHTSNGSSYKNNCDNARMSFSCDVQSKGLTTFSSSRDTQKSHRSRNRTHKSSGSSHKNDRRNDGMPLSHDAQFKGPASTPPASVKVDLSKLDEASLWRYWRYFKLMDVNSNPSEVQLVDTAQTHFMSQKLDEVQVITEFANSAKRLKTLGN
ncbi:putative histone deacetylase complex subunit SAP30/SAP30-like protein [Heracleum sosnowskyi]|uniref:Histone deacetylase complex subunit SAP30/SAP30-like protein n=1 Tax=Heracleum sosnowskyi TaxID=360622 RepID=A0AAD8J0Y8_9APIA|nr:putative histone deacetylase complex subunit SAP30/SAP30-like protein [Heracleum sosnowskyi]